MMQVSWLEHLLADRGIHGKVLSAHIVSHKGELMLELHTHKTDRDGKRFLVFDATQKKKQKNKNRVATEHHLVPIAGMVFEP